MLSRRLSQRWEAATEAILLDGLGTLVELLPPAPALAERLRENHGVELSEADAATAFAAEIAYYRDHHLEGRDPASLADLRGRCTLVLREALPAPVAVALEPPELAEEMLGSIRFRPFPEAEGALRELRARGLGLAVVSNWDVSLRGVLEGLGLGEQLDAIVTSAAVGAAKPDPAPFHRALGMLGAEPGAALHVGDSWPLDVEGARAAGIAPILIERGEEGAAPETRDGVPVIASLLQLLDLV